MMGSIEHISPKSSGGFKAKDPVNQICKGPQFLRLKRGHTNLNASNSKTRQAIWLEFPMVKIRFK